MSREKILFLDESGDHNLNVIDSQYPVFVLGGVIIDKEYAEGQLVDALNEFKAAVFGRTDIVLHTADITRNRSGFEDMQEAKRSATTSTTESMTLCGTCHIQWQPA